jgi:hypothetical protein
MQTPNCVSQSYSFMGPRTVAGKRRSRRNAVKDGLFCKELLLDGEGRIFKELQRGLREDWQPEGLMQELLVRDIAILFLQDRRKSLAQKAMTERSAAFVGINGDSDLPRPALLRAAIKDGTTPLSAKMVLLQMATEKLDELSRNIAEDKSDFEKAQITLFQIYGAFDPRNNQSFCGKLFALTQVGATCETVNSETMSKIKELAQELIDMEIQRLSELAKDVESRDVVCNSVASLVLPQADLERIIRCGTHISREIERKVNLLLQLQRARRGYPPPPTIKVDIG